jgi:hypothetical protein
MSSLVKTTDRVECRCDRLLDGVVRPSSALDHHAAGMALDWSSTGQPMSLLTLVEPGERTHCRRWEPRGNTLSPKRRASPSSQAPRNETESGRQTSSEP